jgi:MFS family permease
VFVQPLEREFGWSRAEVTAAASIGIGVAAFVVPVIGQWTDRTGGRAIAAGGMAVLGACLLLLAATQFLWFYYLLTALLRLSFAAAYIGMASIVTRWFVRRRNLALTIATTGLGLSGAVMVPVTAELVEALSWRGAFLCAGALVLLIGLPLAALVLRSKPGDLGLWPDGEKAAPAPAGGTAEGKEAVDPPRVFRRTLWQLGMVFFLAFVVSQAVSTHAVPFFESQGLSPTDASALFGAAAGAGFGARFLSGLVLDRFLGARRMLLTLLLCQGAGLLGLLAGGWGWYVFMVLFGVAMGGLAMSESLATAAYFGAARFGRAIGRILVFDALGSAAGPILGGLLYDAQGSYTTTLWVLVAISAVNGASVLFLPEAKRARV